MPLRSVTPAVIHTHSEKSAHHATARQPEGPQPAFPVPIWPL
jgi:hypothetical protein